MPVPSPAKLKKEPSQSIFPSDDSKESAPKARWRDGVEWEVPQLTNEEVRGWEKGTTTGARRKGVGPNSILFGGKHTDGKKVEFKVRNGKDGDSRRFLLLFHDGRQMSQMEMTPFENEEEAGAWWMKNVVDPYCKGELDRAGVEAAKRKVLRDAAAKMIKKPAGSEGFVEKVKRQRKLQAEAGGSTESVGENPAERPSALKTEAQIANAERHVTWAVNPPPGKGETATSPGIPKVDEGQGEAAKSSAPAPGTPQVGKPQGKAGKSSAPAPGVAQAGKPQGAASAPGDAEVGSVRPEPRRPKAKAMSQIAVPASGSFLGGLMNSLMDLGSESDRESDRE